MTDLPRSVDVAIIGGGFAGMATAWWLARKDVRDVVVLERESEPGRYASGRSAGLGRQLAEDDLTSALTVVGAAYLRAWFSHAWAPTGGVLSFDDMEHAKGYVARAERLDVPIVRMTRKGVLAMWPQLDALDIEAAIHVPSDGVIDIAALLASYSEAARIETRAAVERVEAGPSAASAARSGPSAASAARSGTSAASAARSGDGALVHTCRGVVRAKVVVDATGAWAGRLTGDPPLDSFKRHVYVLEAAAPAQQPFIWHLGARELYVRSDGERVLVSPCDATPTTPRDEQPDPTGEAALHARLEGLPLAASPVTRAWACQRTFSRGLPMQLGHDATRPWLVWAVGLGGHGATASAAVGEIVANAVIAALG